MKRGIVVMILICVLILAGCAAKPYNAKEADLLKELRDIETSASDAQLVDNETNEVTNILNESNLIESNIIESNESVTDISESAIELVDIKTDELQKLEYNETDPVTLQVDTEDADQDAVLYTFSSPLSEDGTWQTTYGDAGEYVVTVTASDGENKVEQQVLIVVNKKNVPPVVENVPEKLTLKEGETVSLAPAVSDPNKDSYTVSYSLPLNNEGSWVTDHTSAGEYEVLVTASDGELETKIPLLLMVLDVNIPPSVEGLEDDLRVKEGDTVSIKPTLSDIDNDPIELEISGPVGDDGVWETNYTSHGRYEVAVTVSDGKDTVIRTVTIVVEDVNVAPKIIGIRQG